MKNYDKLCEFEIWKNWIKDKRGTLIVVGDDRKEFPFTPTVDDLIIFITMELKANVNLFIGMDRKGQINYRCQISDGRTTEIHVSNENVREALCNTLINFLISSKMKVR